MIDVENLCLIVDTDAIKPTEAYRDPLSFATDMWPRNPYQFGAAGAELSRCDGDTKMHVLAHE